MSVRHLRKVLKEQEEQQRAAAADAESRDGDGGGEGESESPESLAPSSRNPFDLLNDDDDQVSKSDNDAGCPEGNVDKKVATVDRYPFAPVSTFKHRENKKKKKKSTDDSLVSSDRQGKPMDAILESLSLNDLSSSNQLGFSKGKAPKFFDSCKIKRSILQIDPKYLKAENELRRIFGSKVVNSAEKNQAGSSRQARGGRRGAHIPRKCVLVTPSDHWPRWDGCLSMELLEMKLGIHYFRYVPSSSYGQAQEAFDAAKTVHDLNAIASILIHHPYHVGSLITMVEYFKFVGENQMAADSIAKCLYALECAWHPMFTPLQGSCQLKYTHEMNRLLFTVLFSHMKDMDRRGCHRSALEVCKLLLSLDSDDPMGALFCIDYYSLRAEEYSWLEQFCDEYKSDNSLWLFPNMSFSLAICRFYLEASRDFQLDDGKSTSTDLMKQALLLHPPVLKKLVEKVPLNDQAWKNILKQKFFASDETRNPSLDHLINLYVGRSYIIWRLPNLQQLLINGAMLVIDTLNSNKNDAMDWACVRKEAFSSGKNEYGHLLVSDFSDVVPTMPPENLQNFVVDPRMRDVRNGDGVGNPARAPRDLENRSLLAALFESVLPWVDYGEGGAGENIDDQIDNDAHGI